MPDSKIHRLVLLAWFAMFFMLATGCKQDVAQRPANDEPIVAEPEVVVFPDSLRTADKTVNMFLEEAMNACVAGDYERFRLLWSVQHDPITRAQFENAWQAVEMITIMELGRDTANDSYAFFAHVAFDKDRLPLGQELRDNPQRDVVLLIIREQGVWRLARAPKSVREYLTNKVSATREAERLPPAARDSPVMPGD